MDSGHFYYIKDQYFIDFPDPCLMQHKDTVDGQQHNRPCFYAFQDASTGLYWLVPFSSQVEKFKLIYAEKLKRYRRCDTIAFGYVLGHEKAFLIQNMCPITENYILNEYMDGKANVSVRTDKIFEKDLIAKAKKVLTLQRKGIKLIFPDVMSIEAKLLNSLNDHEE